jgi:hypothetical protein
MQARFDALTTEAISQLPREECIQFLKWLDPNGVWTDEDSRLEGYEPVSADDARAKLHEIWFENTNYTQPAPSFEQHFQDTLNREFGKLFS